MGYPMSITPERSMVTKLASAVTLTGTAAAATNVHNCGGYGQHTLYVQYTPGVDSTNALQVTIELSPDYDLVANVGTWFPYTGEYSAGSGTITPGAQVTISFSSDGTAAQNQAPYFFVGSAMGIRIKALETNTPSPFGTYTAYIVSTQP